MPAITCLATADYRAGSGKYLLSHIHICISWTTLLTQACRLFLIEAIVTIFTGVVVWFLLPDCTSTHHFACITRLARNADTSLVPATASWLTEKEKRFVQARLPPNAPLSGEANFKFSEIVTALKDKRLWLFTSIWAFFTVGTSGVTFYQSTVIASLGFT